MNSPRKEQLSNDVALVDRLMALEACTANEEAETLSEAAEALLKLSTPSGVQLNMLRGVIAKPTFREFMHLFPAQWDAIRAAVEYADCRAVSRAAYPHASVEEKKLRDLLDAALEALGSL